MVSIKNDTFLRALKREPVPYTPIWIMRQAGRYLPEYRQTRERAGDFLSLCKNPQFALEVVMQPLARYNLDAAIVFSDILTIPDAMGLGLYFETGEGPKFRRTVRSHADVEALHRPDVNDELGYVMAAVRLIADHLNNSIPLIGFSGSPWTLACYMVEGGSSRDFRTIKTMLYEQPELLHALLDRLATIVADYLDAQIASGANVVQIFDTWGGVLGHSAYREFSLAYMQRIIARLQAAGHSEVPVILFTKGGGQWLPAMAASGAQALGLDWTTDLGAARRQTGGKVALQGNMDPCALFAPAARIRKEVGSLLDSYGDGPGHIFNLGHGILPSIDPERVAVLVDAVHEISAEKRAQPIS